MASGNVINVCLLYINIGYLLLPLYKYRFIGNTDYIQRMTWHMITQLQRFN